MNTIKLRNIDIINAINSANEIMQIKGLPIKTSWNLMKNIKTLERVFKTYTELEQKLIEEYALKDDNGNIKVNESNNPMFPPRSEFFTKQNELFQCEETFDNLLMINLSDLENSGISPATLYNLSFMINDND